MPWWAFWMQNWSRQLLFTNIDPMWALFTVILWTSFNLKSKKHQYRLILCQFQTKLVRRGRLSIVDHKNWQGQLFHMIKVGNSRLLLWEITLKFSISLDFVFMVKSAIKARSLAGPIWSPPAVKRKRTWKIWHVLRGFINFVRDLRLTPPVL